MPAFFRLLHCSSTCDSPSGLQAFAHLLFCTTLQSFSWCCKCTRYRRKIHRGSAISIEEFPCFRLRCTRCIPSLQNTLPGEESHSCKKTRNDVARRPVAPTRHSAARRRQAWYYSNKREVVTQYCNHLLFGWRADPMRGEQNAQRFHATSIRFLSRHVCKNPWCETAARAPSGALA